MCRSWKAKDSGSDDARDNENIYNNGLLHQPAVYNLSGRQASPYHDSIVIHEGIKLKIKK